MKTMKMLARATENGKYTLAVINEDGFAVYTMLTNGSIDEVVTAENWFNFDKLADDQYLIRFYTNGNAHYIQFSDKNGLGNWERIGC